MNEKTLEALQKSIEKWDANAKITELWDARLSLTDCPLCGLFFNDPVYRCCGCPVEEKAQPFCNGTPYVDAADAFNSENLGEFRLAAKYEADFLRSLLPSE